MLKDNDGIPYIEVTFNGKTAKISPLTAKRTLLDKGIVSLGADFEDELPPVAFDNGSHTIELYGCTTDPAIVGKVRKFIKDIGR